MAARTKGRAAPSAEPTVTSAAEWKKRAAGEPQTLPSGPTVRLRRASVLALASQHAPNPFLRPVLTFYADVAQNLADIDQMEPPERLKAHAEIYLGVAYADLVEPRLVLDREPDYDAGEIGAHDLTREDLEFIYDWHEKRLMDALAAIDAQIEDADAARSVPAEA